MFDIRLISQVLAGAAAAALALGLVTAPGAADTMSQFSVGGATAATLASAAKKDSGALRVVVHRSGTYTVEGAGFQQSATATRTFTVPPGRYTVTASGGTVTPGRVRVWKQTQSTVTVTFPGVPVTASAIATGSGGTCAVLPDGTVTCWEHEQWPTPVPVTGVTSATAISVGGSQACALLSDGTVRCWATNYSGSPTGVPVTGIGSATAITVGGSQACALLFDGTVRCWGTDYSGSPTAAPVAGIGPATAISAGFYHTCAVLADGSVACWGANGFGQLGDGTTSQRLSPVPVTGISTATAISAGADHTCAVLSNGTATCWGRNFDGQLGNGTRDDSPTPVPVKQVSAATAIAVGDDSYTCALLADGSALCWGANGSGQLGDGTTTGSSSPVPVKGLRTATALSAGGTNACALLADGAVMCWGSGYAKPAGGTGESSSPLPVAGIRRAIAITAGGDYDRGHTCVLLAGGTVKCWGANSLGQLGDGTERRSSSPVRVKGIRTAIAIAAGKSHTCAVLANGRLKCWGLNTSGELGNGHKRLFGGATTPVTVKGIRNATGIAAGRYHTCAVLSDGSAACWGSNGYGALGSGSTGRRSLAPVPVTGIGNAVAITASNYASTVLLADGTIAWWGEKDPGDSGSRTPVRVKAIRAATAITTGFLHRCALLPRGRVKCWGDNSDGALGDGTHDGSSMPVPVKGIRTATAIAAGGLDADGLTCAVVFHGTVTCWGANWNGQLGNGTERRRSSVPVPVKGIHTATAISAGSSHACALLAGGRVKCWGSNESGQLGTSRLRMSRTPVRVEGP